MSSLVFSSEGGKLLKICFKKLKAYFLLSRSRLKNGPAPQHNKNNTMTILCAHIFIF